MSPFRLGLNPRIRAVVNGDAVAAIALWSRYFTNDDRTGDQHDAFCIAAWLSRANRDGTLVAFLNPDLTPDERTLAQVEGWILGVTNSMRRSAPVTTEKVRPIMGSQSPPLKNAKSAVNKSCPVCGYSFRGGTWGGIDAHWKAFHNGIMPYKEAWPIIKAGGRPSSIQAE